MLPVLATALALATTAPAHKPPPKGAVVLNNISVTPPDGFVEDSRSPDGRKVAFKSPRPPATVSVDMTTLSTPKEGDCRKDLADTLPEGENKVDAYRKLDRVKGKLWVLEKVDYVNDSVKRVILGCDERTGMIVHWEQKTGDLEHFRKPYNRMIDSIEIAPRYGKKK